MREPKQGEILLLLSNRSGKPKSEIAKNLNIDPSHLSKLYKSQFLTSKIKDSASLFFGVPVSVFDEMDIGEVPIPMVREHDIEYNRRFEEMSAGEIFKYIEEKDRRHYEERARLLSIIENLTKK